MEPLDPDKIPRRMEHLQLSVQQARAAAQERTRETEARVERARRLLAISALMIVRAQVMMRAEAGLPPVPVNIP